MTVHSLEEECAGNGCGGEELHLGKLSEDCVDMLLNGLLLLLDFTCVLSSPSYTVAPHTWSSRTCLLYYPQDELFLVRLLPLQQPAGFTKSPHYFARVAS